MVRELSPDMVEIVEYKATKSKKIVSFVAAIKNGLVPRKIIEFWEPFTSKVSSRTCYWIPIDDLDEVKEDTGTWCCVYAIAQQYEEGILTCLRTIDQNWCLYRTRIADRYGSPKELLAPRDEVGGSMIKRRYLLTYYNSYGEEDVVEVRAYSAEQAEELF